MKRIFYSIMALALLASCQTNTTSSSNPESEPAEEIFNVQLSEFDTQAGELVGKTVSLDGTIDHVCKHGGQKMFMVKQDSEARVKITTGEDMAAFNTELEGEYLKVLGIVDELRIDEDYLREWEEELKAEHESEAGEKLHMGEGEGEGEDNHHEEDHEFEQINKYREMIKASGKDYISFYSVVCVEYEVVEKGA